ncbi:MAG: hypothetical protein JOY90_19875 [Bradyrhizobium sp.]|uniref:hypothetical protein n=1 Tax=Bradyrhizobium sp. TaxID=376 RepID=UPI001D9F0240|nr:hypothetical protein [Bradyrhizobium sp.]MBV9562674.1 hypothetical protein [Bradyrhizobium sp.]
MVDPIAILVVEDNEIVQSFDDALAEAGFMSAVAPCGEEALEVLGAGRSYRVILTEIKLSGRLDGWQVARHGCQARDHLHDQRPRARVAGERGDREHCASEAFRAV